MSDDRRSRTCPRFAAGILRASDLAGESIPPRYSGPAQARRPESPRNCAVHAQHGCGERGLLDPFDPVQALPKAAQFLRELKDQFGNLGLAAAAYNAGPVRVRAWLAGTHMLPKETRNYVAAVTGVPADEWAKSGASKPAVKTTPNCRELMARIEVPSDPLYGDRVTPHREALYSHNGMVKQPASSQEPPLSSQATPAQPDDAQFFKGDRIEAPSGPMLGDLVTLHQPSHSHSHINLFLEKLTERVELTADSPWGVQLSGGFSRERVLAVYATIASRYAEILAGRNASILSSVFRSRGTGTFYQIRVGADTFERANDLCVDRRAGGACIVLRNGR